MTVEQEQQGVTLEVSDDRAWERVVSLERTAGSRLCGYAVDTPKATHHEITPLTPERAKLLIEKSVEDRHRALSITALGTGLRLGELLGLRWEDVDLDAGRLRVRYSLASVGGELVLQEPKTDRSRRTLVLPEVVITALRAHRTRQKGDRPLASKTCSTGRRCPTCASTTCVIPWRRSWPVAHRSRCAR